MTGPAQMVAYVLANERTLLHALYVHLGLSVSALLVAAAVCIPLGIWTSRRPAGAGVVGFMTGLRSIPSLAVLALMLPVLGLGTKPALVALILLAIPPILINTDLGYASVIAPRFEAAVGMGMLPGQVFDASRRRSPRRRDPRRRPHRRGRGHRVRDARGVHRRRWARRPDRRRTAERQHRRTADRGDLRSRCSRWRLRVCSRSHSGGSRRARSPHELTFSSRAVMRSPCSPQARCSPPRAPTARALRSVRRTSPKSCCSARSTPWRSRTAA